MAQLNSLATRAIPLLVILGIVLGYNLFLWPDDEPVIAKLSCSLRAHEDQGPVRLGQYTGPLRSVELEGELSHPFEERMYDFDGTARYRIEGKSMTAKARGSVFLDKSLEPDGLILSVLDEHFRKHGGLQISTLNDEGKLDYADSQAFAYADRAFKLSHPMMMHCKTSPPSKWEWFWDALPFG